MSVAFDPERFIAAQEPVWARVTAELTAGHKQSHWMWFIFPQIAGLGMSATSVHYALQSLTAAEAYLAHPVLGPRLIEVVKLMLRHRDKSAETILGGIDAVKFRSCLTLFDAVAGSPPPFADALDAFYAGVRDPETLKRI